MIIRKRLRSEIARLTANSNYYGLQCDLLTADNMALAAEVKRLRQRNTELEEKNGLMFNDISVLLAKNKELVSLTKDQRLKIMSLEAMVRAVKRRNEDARTS